MTVAWLESMVGLVFALPFGYAVDWAEDRWIKQGEGE